ncbi:TORTIFOLIA1-like protein 4 [Nymphaea colorata]|nr:TORTIFOLIA1-like protein 4 [Nymphaea colorata]
MPAEPTMYPASFGPRSAGKRSALTPQQAIHELRQRTVSYLNKLADRDTFRLASAELESLARSLTPELFSPFLSCLSDTDSEQKAPVRRECARLLGTMAEAHGDALAGFVPKMVAGVLRRLKDADSSVRASCAEAVRAVAERVTRAPVSVILKPLIDSLGEQSYGLQAGSALCLVSAIEGSPDPDPAYLQRMVPKVVKLLGSQSFKAKPALLAVVSAIIGSGAAESRAVLALLVPAVTECMKSNDWATRKAAAEAIWRLAIVDSEAASWFRSRCVDSLESCRFDKVKHVRDSVNQALDAYKNVPYESEEISPSKGDMIERRSSLDAKSTNKAVSNSSFLRKKELSRSLSPPDAASATGTKKKSATNGKKSSPGFSKIDTRGVSDWKIEIAVPRTMPFKVVCEDGLEANESGGETRISSKDAMSRDRSTLSSALSNIFDGNGEERNQKFSGRSASRIVPLREIESSISTVVASNAVEALDKENAENDLSLIRKQLLQIENQQTSLLDLLQMFIGSSQNGMRSLESRVHGLEVALDEISHDLAVSTGRVHSIDNIGNRCCILPGTEFLSSKFWRKAEGRYTSGRFSVSGPTSSGGMYSSVNKESIESSKWENRRFRGVQGGLVVNPLADVHPPGAVEALHGDIQKQGVSITDSVNEGSSITSAS